MNKYELELELELGFVKVYLWKGGGGLYKLLFS